MNSFLKYILSAAAVLSVAVAGAQTSVGEYLKLVEENSSFLKAERSDADARRLESRVGVAPENPEVSYSHMPGIKGTVGTRKAYGVSQNIEWFGKYFAAAKLGQYEREQAEAQLDLSRREILLNSKLLYYNIVYLQKRGGVLAQRVENAEKLLTATQAIASSGEATALDLNRAKLFLTSVRSAMAENQSMLSAARSQLSVAAGGIAISSVGFSYSENVSVNFEDAVAEGLLKNPDIVVAELDSAKSARNVSVQRAATLPSFSVGFAGEMVTGTDNFRGISAGITVPLWGGINRVRSAKASATAAAYRAESKRIEIEAGLRDTKNNAEIARQNFFGYMSLDEIDEGKRLLTKNFELRNIGFTDFLTNLQFYYDSEEEYLVRELEVQVAVARLFKYRL